MAKDKDYATLTFHIAVDEKGNVRGDEDSEGARERLMDNTDGDCCDVWQVTVKVPRAKLRKVHLGTITVADDGQASIGVEDIQAV